MGLLQSLFLLAFKKMGSRKFGAFILYSSLLSTLFELLFFNIFFDTERYSGPYPQIGAVLYLFHRYTPRLYPKFFGVLGFDFSEKAVTYGLCMQVIFSGGLSTIIPTVFGVLAGMISVGLSVNELPDFVYTICGTLGKSIIDDAPAVMMARSVQRAGRARGSGGRGGRNDTRNATPAVQQPPQPPPPPSEEAIEQLTSMGFDREAVIRALEMSTNNVEAAANRLLAS